jgi:hypothetical protein
VGIRLVIHDKHVAISVGEDRVPVEWLTVADPWEGVGMVGEIGDMVMVEGARDHSPVAPNRISIAAAVSFASRLAFASAMMS